MPAGTTPFMGDKNGQFSPSDGTSAKDCMAAVGAGLAERASVGKWRFTHSAVRRASGAPGTRGLYPGEVVTAISKLTGGKIKITPVYNVARVTVKDTIRGGSACGVSIDTSVTRWTTRATNTYVGPHQILVVRWQLWPGAGDRCACEKRVTTPHEEYLVDDPGTTATGYLWWSAELLYKAAEKRTNYNGINLLVAPDTEAAKWKSVMTGKFRTLPKTDAPAAGTIPQGVVFVGGRTQNGGNWENPAGQMANGWIHIKTPTGRWVWGRGEAFQRA